MTGPDDDGGNGGPALRFSVETRVEELDRMSGLVDALAERENLPADAVFQIKLALEEILMNVISHGHDDNRIHQVDISLTPAPGTVTVEIADDGRPFDPLTDAPEPDTDASIEERRVGGLGVYFVRELMDEVRYRREDGKNRLVLVKRIDA